VARLAAVPIQTDADLQTDPREPLALRTRETRAPAIFGDRPSLEIEYTSRGDRVPGHVLLPTSGDGPHPVLIVQHGLNGSRVAEYMTACGRWADGGAAVASIDLPLHGARASAKMSERLALSAGNAIGGRDLDRVETMLWTEFTRQAVLDLRHLVDALEQIEQIDAQRLVYVGFSLGGILGSVFCGVDERPRAAAFAIAGAGESKLGSALDPLPYIAKIAPRPLLFVNAEKDALISRAQTERFYEAASDPKEIHWYDCGHTDLPGIALKKIWNFASAQLGID
jgi:dienelactone hydrolase